MSEEDVFLENVRLVFKDSADILIADFIKMADGDLGSWLFGIGDIGYFEDDFVLEWKKGVHEDDYL